jgi:hypothetical protein
MAFNAFSIGCYGLMYHKDPEHSQLSNSVTDWAIKGESMVKVPAYQHQTSPLTLPLGLLY